MVAKSKKDLTASVDQGAAMKRVAEIEKEVGLVLKKLKGLPAELADDEDYRTACELLVGVVERRKYVDGERDGFLTEARAMIARVESWFAKAYEEIGEAEGYFRGALATYALKLDARAHGLRKAAGLLPARDEDKATKMLNEAKVCVVPKVAGIAITTKARVEILDEKKIPEEYFRRVVDVKKVEAALEAGEVVTGARLVVEKGVRVTPSHAKKDE